MIGARSKAVGVRTALAIGASMSPRPWAAARSWLLRSALLNSVGRELSGHKLTPLKGLGANRDFRRLLRDSQTNLMRPLDYASRAASPESLRATPMCRAKPGFGCQVACSSVSPALRSSRAASAYAQLGTGFVPVPRGAPGRAVGGPEA